MQVHQRFFRELKSNSFWQSENLQILIFFSFFKEHFRLFSCHHNLMSRVFERNITGDYHAYHVLLLGASSCEQNVQQTLWICGSAARLHVANRDCFLHGRPLWMWGRGREGGGGWTVQFPPTWERLFEVYDRRGRDCFNHHGRRCLKLTSAWKRLFQVSTSVDETVSSFTAV